MDLSVIVQIVACVLATLCSIGAMFVAVWTVHESKRPQPVAYLEHARDKSTVLLVVENFGSRVATDIKITGFSYVLVAENKKSNVKRSFVENGIPMLVPGARRDAILLTENDDMADYFDASCVVKLSYLERGLLGQTKPCDEEFVLDMGSFAGSLYTKSDFHNLALAAKSMADSLERMSG